MRKIGKKMCMCVNKLVLFFPLHCNLLDVSVFLSFWYTFLSMWVASFNLHFSAKVGIHVYIITIGRHAHKLKTAARVNFVDFCESIFTTQLAFPLFYGH